MRRFGVLVALLFLVIPSSVSAADPLHQVLAWDNCSATFTVDSSEGQVWAGAIDQDYTIEQEYTACDHATVGQDLFRVLLFYGAGNNHPTLSVTGPDGQPVLVTGPYRNHVQRSLMACTTHAQIGTYVVHVGGTAKDSDMTISSGGSLSGDSIEAICP